MRHDTPLRKRHDSLRADPAPGAPGAPGDAGPSRPGAATGRRVAPPAVEYVPYGPPDEEGLIACEVPSTFGSVEAEYAAIRRGAGLLDCPHRGTLRVTGGERRDFLDRMLTQDLRTLVPGRVLRSFWLNRQGRIEGDLAIAEMGDFALIDVDVHQAAPVAETLRAFLFTEDVAIGDASDELHHIAAHGPAAQEIVRAAASGPAEPLASCAARTFEIAGVVAALFRRDQTGAPGIEIVVPRAGADAVWEALLAGGAAGRVRPVGWYAYNIARIEAGTPLFNIDFGPTNLPHETGVVEDRVSFTKGCYLGQEIVARMQNLGRPKQMLVGLRMKEDLLPVAGGQVFERSGEGAERSMGALVGTITSSTLSPMLGAAPVAFAMLRTAHAEEGATVLVSAEGEQAEATVTGLRFWTAEEAS